MLDAIVSKLAAAARVVVTFIQRSPLIAAGLAIIALLLLR
jgi:hypothetical protein